MKIDTSSVTGLILAGGRGSRMGNIDKGLQRLDGKPMAAHVIDRLHPQVGGLMINANQNLDVYAGFGYPVWPDALAGFAGPLAGLQAGLMHCTTPLLVTAPCDSPFLPADLVERLGAALASANAELAIAVTVEEGRRQSQPVFCLLQAALLPQLDDYLQQGGRKVDAWYRSLALVEVAFPEAMAFRNINTLEELQQHQAK